MLAVARVLGECLASYFSSYSGGNRDCRLLVPGLTPKIARQVHDFLVGEAIKSYLVVGEDGQPGEETGLIRAVGLTSKRIGSFVAIASPGQLAHIQDSIRGSGGTIRSIAFSEEWPWIDDGSEAFRFDGPVLDRLVEKWSGNQDEQKWIREFTLNGLVQSTQASSRRAQLLLEEILGAFGPSCYPEIDGIRNRFLFHSGVPLPSDDIPGAKKLIRTTSRLGQKVIERCQGEEDIREQAKDRVEEIESIPNDEKEGVRNAVDSLLDGIGKSTTMDLGLLAFYSCWGPDKNDPSYWRLLTANRLAEIFNVKEHEKAKISCDVQHCNRAVVASAGNKLATFVGEEVRLSISYEIPPDQFDDYAWEIQVLNRQRVLSRRKINDAHGEFPFTFNTAERIASYSRKVPVRVALFRDGAVDADTRIDMHLCGEDRPAYTVVEPGFYVVDATPSDSEEAPDMKLDVDEPVHLYLFSHDATGVSMEDGDETSLDVIETGMDGIWRSVQPVDVGAEPSGQVVRACRFGDHSTVICFEAKSLERGEFTLEDEFRLAISGPREQRLNELTDLFLGKSRKPYPALGQINDTARQRMTIARAMTSRTGWRPLLIDFFEPGSQGVGSLGNFINHVGHVDEDIFRMLELPGEALPLIETYSNTRDTVRREIESRIDGDGVSLEHPVYASHPIFSRERANETEQALVAYLEAYYAILDYLGNKQEHMEWLQLFVFSHLDCAVHWDNSRLRNAFFLVGPWHPLALAKRYMVQAALLSRAERILQRHDHKPFRSLVSLLGRVQGFRWLIGISADDRELDPMYVLTTSDPGWHLAFKTSCNFLAIEEGIGGLTGVLRRIRYNFDLTTGTMIGASETLVTTCLSNYSRAFPSRRSVGVRIRRGYVERSIVAATDRYLHGEEVPTKQGMQLPGGVRLYFEDNVGDTGDARWSDPPFYLYRFPYDNDAECIQNEHPDIYMLPPTGEALFKGTSENYGLPRGTGLETVFAQPLNWLTEGQSLVPKSITYEFDVSQRAGEGIGRSFARATTKTGSILGNALVAVRSVDLPQRLNAPWVVVPGEGIDPAVLVKYVRDGADRAIQERALWDYKLDIERKDTTFFILSTIPRGFQVAVNGFFDRNDIANGFVVELGRIGISIGGEALKSGRHALGVVGLVGAVRLFIGVGSTSPVPIVCNSKTVGFLVPVDSFASFFGNIGPAQPGFGRKRADLLAIQVALPGEEHGRMTISCSGIEAKFTSRTFVTTRARAALDQARATVTGFKMLVEASLCSGAMPERLGLLEILKFGLRISSPSDPSKTGAWLQTEAAVYEAVLAGNYEYCDPKHIGVLVTTEEQLPGVAEHIVFPDGLWVRLTKRHWPGISDTQQLDSIRQELSSLFSTCVEQVTRVDAAPTRAPLKAKVSPGTEPTGKESGATRKSTIMTAVHEKRVDIEPGGEVDLETSPLDQVFLGVDDRRRSVYFDPQSPVDPLDNMNLMVTGSSGTGKTQLLKYVICKVREQDKPVLILDFKNDFASDTSFAERSGLDRIFVAFDGLLYNPLIPYPVRHPATGELFVQCGQHIAGIASVLKRTYGLGAQQQAAVRNAMVTAFSSAGIPTSGSTRYSDEMNFPDFSHVGDTLQHDNPSAYNRLDPLFTLGLFKNEFRKASFHALVGRPAILDLSQIPSDEIRNTLAQLVVLSAHAYYNSRSHSGTIRQVLVFDEAHRVLNSDYMLKLVRECRAYGVATVLSSQYPSDFPSEISASMATKVVHGNGRDSERVKGIIQLIGCEGREGDVANLERFQGFVDNRHHPHTLVRTMNYPLYLVWTKLRETGTATREELARAGGVDTSKLPVGNLVRQLEQLGLAEEREGQVSMLDNI